MYDSRFESLLDGYQSGEAAPSEVAELEQFLRQDASLRTIFVEYTLLHAHLHKASRTSEGESVVVRKRRWHVGPVGRRLAAAVMLLAVGLSLFFVIRQDGKPIHEVVSGQVSIDGAPAARIPEGTPFEVSGNRPAVIRMSDASRAELAPTSKAVIQARRGDARQVVTLTHGQGKFQVTHGTGQFRVETPIGVVTALGTEFSVKLRPAGKTAGRQTGAAKGSLWMAVNVTDGSVQVDTRTKSYQLAVGDRRVFGDDGEQNNVDDGDQNNQDDGDRG